MTIGPGVDIVMRTKNRPTFLPRALDDVLAQEYPGWTLIIVNDGGDPGPVQEQVAQRPGLEGRVRIVNLPHSVGRGAAVLPGLDAGESPLIAIHDDDDTWHPQFLARTVEHLEAYNDVAVCVRTQIVRETTALQETGRELFHAPMQEPTYFDLLRFNHVVPISLVYRRRIHSTVDVNGQLRSVFDWDFNMRLWQAGPVGFLDGEPLAFWHQRQKARGDAANSVIGEGHSHILYDRRVRDEALREYANWHGGGDSLFLSKYVDERLQDVGGRLERIEAQQQEVIRLLRE